MAVMEAAADGSQRISIDLAELTPPTLPSHHDLTRAPRGPILIPVSDLEQVAEHLDDIDATDSHRPRSNWLGRLREANGQRKFEILAPDATEVRCTTPPLSALKALSISLAFQALERRRSSS
jgi:hypothetical protein